MGHPCEEDMDMKAVQTRIGRTWSRLVLWCLLGLLVCQWIAAYCANNWPVASRDFPEWGITVRVYRGSGFLEYIPVLGAVRLLLLSRGRVTAQRDGVVHFTTYSDPMDVDLDDIKFLECQGVVKVESSGLGTIGTFEERAN